MTAIQVIGAACRRNGITRAEFRAGRSRQAKAAKRQACGELRALASPRTGKPLSWSVIAALVGFDHTTAQYWGKPGWRLKRQADMLARYHRYKMGPPPASVEKRMRRNRMFPPVQNPGSIAPQFCPPLSSPLKESAR